MEKPPNGMVRSRKHSMVCRTPREIDDTIQMLIVSAYKEGEYEMVYNETGDVCTFYWGDKGKKFVPIDDLPDDNTLLHQPKGGRGRSL